MRYLIIAACVVIGLALINSRFPGLARYMSTQFFVTNSGAAQEWSMIDFADAQGTVNPSSYWDPDLAISNDWIKWYANDKVKYNYVKVDKWLRAPRLATAYENENEASKSGASTTFSKAGVSDTDKSAEFLKLIENSNKFEPFYFDST